MSIDLINASKANNRGRLAKQTAISSSYPLPNQVVKLIKHGDMMEMKWPKKNLVQKPNWNWIQEETLRLGLLHDHHPKEGGKPAALFHAQVNHCKKYFKAVLEYVDFDEFEQPEAQVDGVAATINECRVMVAAACIMTGVKAVRRDERFDKPVSNVPHMWENCKKRPAMPDPSKPARIPQTNNSKQQEASLELDLQRIVAVTRTLSL
jgi:hypothetical protein